MKPRSFEFRDDCWNADFILVWPVDTMSLRAFIADRLPNADLSLLDDEDDTFAGTCDIYDNHHIIALTRWRGTTDDIALLSHECNHAALDCLFTKGAKIDEDNQEPLAYLQESLLRRCLERLRRKG